MIPTIKIGNKTLPKIIENEVAGIIQIGKRLAPNTKLIKSWDELGEAYFQFILDVSDPQYVNVINHMFNDALVAEYHLSNFSHEYGFSHQALEDFKARKILEIMIHDMSNGAKDYKRKGFGYNEHHKGSVELALPFLEKTGIPQEAIEDIVTSVLANSDKTRQEGLRKDQKVLPFCDVGRYESVPRILLELEKNVQDVALYHEADGQAGELDYNTKRNELLFKMVFGKALSKKDFAKYHKLDGAELEYQEIPMAIENPVTSPFAKAFRKAIETCLQTKKMLKPGDYEESTWKGLVDHLIEYNFGLMNGGGINQFRSHPLYALSFEILKQRKDEGRIGTEEHALEMGIVPQVITNYLKLMNNFKYSAMVKHCEMKK